MTVKDLGRRLEIMGVPSHMYSLLTDGFPNEAFCLNKADGQWEVYYSERGKKRGKTVFDEEAVACEYMLNKLKPYEVGR